MDINIQSVGTKEYFSTLENIPLLSQESKLETMLMWNDCLDNLVI